MTGTEMNLKTRLKVKTPEAIGLFWRRVSNLEFAIETADKAKNDDMKSVWEHKLYQLMLGSVEY